MKIGFIGTGNMAQAIIHGILANNLMAKEDIFVSSGHYENAQRFLVKLGSMLQTNQRDC